MSDDHDRQDCDGVHHQHHHDQLAALTEENERLNTENKAQQAQKAYEDEQAKSAALTEECARLKFKDDGWREQYNSMTRRAVKWEDEAAFERARADRNRDENLSTIKDLAEAEQRAAAWKQALLSALVGTGREDAEETIASIETDIDRILQSPNPESETDDG